MRECSPSLFVDDLLSGIPYYFDFTSNSILLELLEGKLQIEEFINTLGLATHELAMNVISIDHAHIRPRHARRSKDMDVCVEKSGAGEVCNWCTCNSIRGLN